MQQLLLAHGADVKEIDDYGNSPTTRKQRYCRASDLKRWHCRLSKQFGLDITCGNICAVFVLHPCAISEFGESPQTWEQTSINEVYFGIAKLFDRAAANDADGDSALLMRTD
ncbi:hypothetical protein P3T76_006244 [Phytophthora citrophthora]|uniref:Uncharacterized protein n=1 Tax=Phytophthora citrophthora TaxID=4793 RepID=A0AAD9GQH4_9STRA|nr:hypothetical protein P3T76_006244 [Phytophthora citrophthora]